MSKEGMSIRYGDEIEVGYELEDVRRSPTNVQLFRYCATTWNSHRIHYDKDYAASEGYPNVLVQSHLHGAFLTSYCTNWAGTGGRLLRLEYSVRRFATPGDVLICKGKVIQSKPSADGFRSVQLELVEERESDGAHCAIGGATILLPLRGQSA